MAARVENFRVNPPAVDRDGSWHLDHK
jgi:hypothetical protein